MSPVEALFTVIGVASTILAYFASVGVLAIRAPVKETVQVDGRIRRWVQIAEAEGRYLRVVLLADGETVHNAFFDRRFVP